MNEQLQNTLRTGLRNAHAMEHQALSIIKPQIKRIEHYPEVEQRLEAHLEETHQQIRRIETGLEMIGEQASGVKDATLSFGGTMAALGHTFAPDEILKNAFANFAFENYETAAYKSLLTLAEHAQLADLSNIIRANLNEEIAMARWVEEHLDELTLRFVALQEAGQSAKS